MMFVNVFWCKGSKGYGRDHHDNILYWIHWQLKQGSGYGYGTVPGGRWAIDTEGGHVVVSVSLKKMAMNTEGDHVVDSVSRTRYWLFVCDYFMT